MVAPIGINTNAYTQVDTVRNMQHVGGQTQVTKKNDVEPSAQQQTHIADGVQLSDNVTFTQDAQENASHVGLVQNQFAEEEIGAAGEDSAEVNGLLGETVVSEEEGEAAPAGPATDENGFILLDENGNVTGGSGPIDGGNGGDGGDDGVNTGYNGYDPYAYVPGESETDRANRIKAYEEDAQAAQKIFLEMAAERQKWLAELLKIITDSHNAMMEIMQSVAQNKAASMDRIRHNWERVFHER